MAKAYACDRCGELFKQSEYKDGVSVILENGTPFCINFGDEYVHLCPKCRAGFQKWWDTDAIRKTTDDIHRCNIYEVPEENEDE